jgi:hypothetical protein
VPTTVTFRIDQWQQAALPAINAGLTAAAMVCANKAVESFGASPSPPGGPPGVDTGHLRRSIAFVSPEAANTPLKAHFGTAVAYGRHLEFGAFITPKKAKYLLVPVDRALAARLRRIGAGAGARAIPGLKYIPPGRGKRHGGRLVLAKSVRVSVRGNGKKSRTVSAGKTAFVLKDSVRIQPRPWIMRAAIIGAPDAVAAARQVCKERLMAAGTVKR